MTIDMLREKNLETVKKFLSLRGPERGKGRAPLFTEDARVEYKLYADGQEAECDKPALEWAEENDRHFPDWGFYDAVIFESEDPNVFLVKCHGIGHWIREDGEIPWGSTDFINEFVMREGKIRRFRETFNPCEANHR